MSSSSIRFETQNFRWTVDLVRADHQTTATATATATVTGRPSRSGQPSEHTFQVTESDQDVLFDCIRGEIERHDRPVKKGDSED